MTCKANGILLVFFRRCTVTETTETKPDPEVGMPVTWIDPESDPPNKMFIQRRLIEKYGRDEITVLTAEKFPGDWVVTLNRNGNPIRNEDKKDISRISWHYLWPL
jgi:hypothetical protein